MASIDREDILEVLYDITPPRSKGRSYCAPTTPEDDDVRSTGHQIGRFLEDLPGHVTIAELRDLVTEAIGRTQP